MKKLIVAMMAAVLAIAPVTALASPSNYSPAGKDIRIISAIDKDGNEMNECHEIRLRDILSKDRESVDNVEKDANLKLVLGNKYSEGLQVIAEADAYLFDILADKEVDWEDGEEHFPVTITFQVPGVKAGSVVHVLHGYDGLNGNPEDGKIDLAEWHSENIVSVGDNTVTVVFKHLSPVVFLVDNPTQGDGGVSSPSTGEGNFVTYAGIFVVAAMVAVVASKKKAA